MPTFPHEPADTQELVEVADACLTPVKQGPIRAIVEPTRWLRGAVHRADGHLVVASQKIGGLHGSQGVQADPNRVPVPADAERLTGTWLYGGHWVQHFGHFFVETVTTLWPDPDIREREDVQGLVFHRYFGKDASTQPWQHELLGLAGYGDLPVVVVDREPHRVDRLLVPSRSVTVNGWAHPGAVDVWRRMADAAGPPASAGNRVFFSRRDFNQALREADKAVRTTARRDQRLDEAFAGAGFDVVAPETLSMHDQIRLAAGADVLAGSAGTALHLSAFAPPGTRVVELGDRRSPTVRVPTQRVIDHVLAHPGAFIPHDVPASQVPEVLAGLGL